MRITNVQKFSSRQEAEWWFERLSRSFTVHDTSLEKTGPLTIATATYTPKEK